MTIRLIRNKTPHQIILYTDSEQSPEKAYPLPPRSAKSIDLDDTQLAFVRINYPTTDIQIG